MKTKTTTDTIKNFLRFIGAAVATGVTCFVLMLMFIKPTEFFAIILNEAVVGLLGLAGGAVIGFVAGAISAYIRASKEVVEKEKIIAKKDAVIIALRQQLKDAEHFVKDLLRSRNILRKSADSNRVNDMFKQIADLSDEEAPEEPEENEEMSETTLQEEPVAAES